LQICFEHTTVFTSAGPPYREHGPSTRPASRAVFAGRQHGCVYRAPVSTGRVGEKHCKTMLFANTARGHGHSVHATRDHGPWTRHVITDSVYGTYFVCRKQQLALTYVSLGPYEVLV